MLPIPAGVVEIADPATGELAPVEVGPFWLAETETTWDMYDIYIYGLDEPEGAGSDGDSGADAASRPSRPYIPPDRGFGHAGYPAISLTRQGAEQFCAWLSAKTGRTYRLPTEAEWIHAAGAGAEAPYFFGDDPAQLGDYAWFAGNSLDSTHPVGEKAPNPHGLRDVYGNVGEWVAAEERIIMGGSFLDPADECTTRARQQQDRSWNATDPQIPKSPWWLSDGSFVGFRVLCEGVEIRE